LSPSGAAQYLLIHSNKSWAGDHEYELVRISGPILNRETVFHAIGCGKYLTGYIASRLLRPKISFDEAVPIAIYMVDEAKNHVDGCGGDTHVVTLSAEGKIEQYSQNSIIAGTEQLREADWIARRIVDLAIHPDLSEDHLRTLVDQWLDSLRKLREKIHSKE
jgi:hypothetical protein